MAEYVILVDENDCQIGLEEKVKCHLPNGKLHRAFTALIFDHAGNLLLARRAKEKMLWPGDWDGTVASHPRESETYSSSAERRLPEELGITCNVDYLGKFEYHIQYKDIGSENEICGTILGVINNDEKINPIDTEIDKTRWISASELSLELVKNYDNYCPWMLIALLTLDKNKKFQKYEEMLSTWVNGDMKNVLINATQKLIPNESWRFIS